MTDDEKAAELSRKYFEKAELAARVEAFEKASKEEKDRIFMPGYFKPQTDIPVVVYQTAGERKVVGTASIDADGRISAVYYNVLWTPSDEELPRDYSLEWSILTNEPKEIQLITKPLEEKKD